MKSLHGVQSFQESSRATAPPAVRSIKKMFMRTHDLEAIKNFSHMIRKQAVLKEPQSHPFGEIMISLFATLTYFSYEIQFVTHIRKMGSL